MSSPSKRRESDVIKLMMNDYKVEMIGDELNELHVEFHGPKETLYEGGVWKIHVLFPESYPYDPPHITFTNKIYHPNVCERFGFVCLNVLANDWNSTLDLLNVFDTFLPMLLREPNPSDPLNRDAASLMMTDKQQYGLILKEYCERYAKGQAANQAEEGGDDGDTSSGGSEPSIDENTGTLGPMKR